MRSTGHETTQRTHDILRVRYAALQHPRHASTDIEDNNEGGASEQGVLLAQARALHCARTVAQAAPEVRVAKVEAARRALQERTLTLDGQALAEKLLQAARTERQHA
jgi:anti-sigma28 factor (negative regulator of flagellin synthesis)